MNEQCQVCYETFLSECITNGICRACQMDIELETELGDTIRILESMGDDICSRRKPAEARRVPPIPQGGGCTYKLGRTCAYCSEPDNPGRIADQAPKVYSHEGLDAHWRCTREAIWEERG